MSLDLLVCRVYFEKTAFFWRSCICHRNWREYQVPRKCEMITRNVIMQCSNPSWQSCKRNVQQQDLQKWIVEMLKRLWNQSLSQQWWVFQSLHFCLSQRVKANSVPLRHTKRGPCQEIFEPLVFSQHTCHQKFKQWTEGRLSSWKAFQQGTFPKLITQNPLMKPDSFMQFLFHSFFLL